MKIEFLLRFFTEVSFLGILLSLASNLSIKLLISQLYYKPDSVSGYESGLYTTRGAREKDRISFYTLGLTFLIFDLELLLIFPFLFSITFATKYTFLSACIFLILLGLDFVYELYNEVLIAPTPTNEKQIEFINLIPSVIIMAVSTSYSLMVKQQSSKLRIQVRILLNIYFFLALPSDGMKES